MGERFISANVGTGTFVAAGKDMAGGGARLTADIHTPPNADFMFWAGGELGFVTSGGRGSATGSAGAFFGNVTLEPHPFAAERAVALGNRRICSATPQAILVNGLPLTFQFNTERTSVDLAPAVGFVSDRVDGIERRVQVGLMARYARFLDEGRRALLSLQAQLGATNGGHGNNRRPDDTTFRTSEGWGVYAEAGAALTYRLGRRFSMKIEAAVQDNVSPIALREWATGDLIAASTQHNWGVTGGATTVFDF